MPDGNVSFAPFFVVGNRRSGTTLLRLMLTCHPNLGVPPEGGFVVMLGWTFSNVRFDDKSVRRRFIDDFLSIETSVDWDFTADDLENILSSSSIRTYKDALHAIYAAYLRKVYPGKLRWGDKTTWYSEYLEQIDDYFPESKIIHIVRDGRDVAVSYKGVPHLSDDVARVARTWAVNFRIVSRAARRFGPSRICRVRYEDLVGDPEGELKRICVFLGEEFSDEMLDFWKINSEKELEPERHMSWKEKTRMPVTNTSVGRWKQALTKDEVRKFESVAGRELRELGYETVLPGSSLQIIQQYISLFLAEWSFNLMKRLRPKKAMLLSSIDRFRSK